MQNDESDEVDALPDRVEVVEFVHGVPVETVCILFVGKEEGGSGYLCMTPHVKEKHGMGADSLHDSNEEIRLNVDLDVDEMIALGVSWGK